MNNNINVKLTPPQGIRVEDTTVYVYDNSSIGDGILTIQKNSETIDTFTANSKVDKTVNITVPTQASDIGALPDTTVIPTVNDATLTIQKNGSNVATFTANSSSNATANITVPTKTSDLTNDDGFITGISSSDITTALGYTPADSSSLATVATSGLYSDLIGTPTIPTVNNPTITITQGGVNKGSFTLNQSSGETIALDAGGGGSLPSQTGNAGKFLTTDGTAPSWASITIPTVNNATLTIQKNGTTVQTFTANASTNATANITVPTDTGDLTNGAGFITGIDSSDVTTALGYTPVNPTSLSTVATTGAYSDLTGKPTIPTVNDATLTIQKNGTSIGTFTANQSTDETINITAMETDVSNITSTGKTACAGFAFPSSTYENLTLGSTGSEYTAPANGWFVLYKTAASSSQQISLEVQGNGIASKCIAGGNNQPLMIHVPVKKGDIMNVYYSASGTTNYFRFVYAKGEV